jgi:TonB family protein
MEATDVLRARMHEPEGLQRMILLSIAAHVALAAVLFLVPYDWFSSARTEPPNVMTISLDGGGGGPRTGSTAIGGRPTQVQAPPEAVKRPEPLRPPAAKAPEMTIPEKDVRTRPRGSTAVKEAPDDARGRTPIKGAETSPGTAAAFTGARGQGFGLSGGGGGAGNGLTLDVGDFCCPDYLRTMVDRVKSNWDDRQNVAGVTIVRFTIQRSGQLTDIAITRSSGYPILDLAAQRAIVLTRQLPPLPAAFPNPTLTLNLNFQYQQ